MDVTKPYEFIGLGAMDVTKPHQFYRVWGHGLPPEAFLKDQENPRLGQTRVPGTGRSLKVDPVGTGRPQSTSRGEGGRPGIYFKAGSTTTEGPAPNLLSPLIYFHSGSTFNDRPVPDFRLSKRNMVQNHVQNHGHPRQHGPRCLLGT